MIVKQCRLRQGTTVLTTWIPERGAKVGAQVELKGRDGLWDVLNVFSSMDETDLKAKQRQDRKGLPSVERGWRE